MKIPSWLLLAQAPLVSALCGAPTGHPNVLFIVADDLRPELGCYGKSQIISPNIDRLAARGLVFNRAYCQQALCNPSRASLLTGLRPDSAGVYDLQTHFRQKVPNVVTLPQQFKNHGYHTQSLGKVFHPAFAMEVLPGSRNLEDPPSWSVPPWRGGPRYYYTPHGEEIARTAFALEYRESAAELDEWTEYLVHGLATEAPDVPDNMLYDGEMTDRAINVLRELGQRQNTAKPGEGTPFFLAVGFLKPHLAYVAPKKYWDLYDESKIEPADNIFPPKDAPPIALQNSWNEILAQYDIPKTGALTSAHHRHLRHGYYACVSFVDAQVGRLLAELDRLGLRDNTIIVFWGDNGYNLGEHSLWAKLNDFENDLRVPLIISAPGAKTAGKKTDALVELVDVYPSLCEMAGLPLPPHLEGTSFVPLLKDPGRAWKSAAFGEYPRLGMKSYKVIPLVIPNPDESYTKYPEEDTMGYSMRTDRYRLTLWQAMRDPSQVIAIELYDHQTDPAENVNIAGRAENAALVKELTAILRLGWRAARPPD